MPCSCNLFPDGVNPPERPGRRNPTRGAVIKHQKAVSRRKAGLSDPWLWSKPPERVTRGPDQIFTRFSALPPELRLYIWDAAMEADPSPLVSCNTSWRGGNFQILKLSPKQAHALLHVPHESRRAYMRHNPDNLVLVAEKSIPRWREAVGCVPQFPVNLSRDVFYFWDTCFKSSPLLDIPLRRMQRILVRDSMSLDFGARSNLKTYPLLREIYECAIHPWQIQGRVHDFRPYIPPLRFEDAEFCVHEHGEEQQSLDCYCANRKHYVYDGPPWDFTVQRDIRSYM
ncbi:hypothetical protein GE09DRAFT_1144331, partial [Coniochaeta sp. 2T2.1]